MIIFKKSKLFNWNLMIATVFNTLIKDTKKSMCECQTLTGAQHPQNAIRPRWRLLEQTAPPWKPSDLLYVPIYRSPLKSNHFKQPLERISNNQRHIHSWRRLTDPCLLPAKQLLWGMRNPRDPSSLQLSWFQAARRRRKRGASENSPWWGRFSGVFKSSELLCWSLGSAVNQPGPSYRETERKGTCGPQRRRLALCFLQQWA